MISALDQDYYKLTTLQLFWKNPELAQANAEYKVFTRKTPWPFTKYEHLKNKLNIAASIQFTTEDIEYLESLEIFEKDFLKWLHKQKLQTKHITLLKDYILITGPLLETTLWEIPILSAINEINQRTLSHQDWSELRDSYIYDAGMMHDLQFAEFGTRRRHSLDVQDLCVNTFFNICSDNFLGTSNLYLAKKYGIKPIGTVPHEYPMALYGLYQDEIKANQVMCDTLPEGGIAITDTFTTKKFLEGLTENRWNRLDGFRIDSGDPNVIVKSIKHKCWNEGWGDWSDKQLIFSDGLNSEKCIQIHKNWDNTFKIKFGIGTYFSNPFNPIDCVMKLTQLNQIPVYKITDDPEKSTKC